MSWSNAFRLSKEEVNDARPPGTENVEVISRDDQHNASELGNHPHETETPLALPQWHRTSALLVVSIYAFVANITSSIIAPALQLWPVAFPQDSRSYSDLTMLIAVNVLLLGAANIWWVPLSNWAGRRTVLIVATLVMTLSSVWCALATSYNSLLAARIFQGIGGAAADTVAPAVVGELYPLYERGRAMAVYTAFLCLGPVVGGIAGGYIAFAHGWASLFWVSVGLSGFCLLSVVLLVPETLYSKAQSENSSTTALDTQLEQKTVVGHHAEHVHPESLSPASSKRISPFGFGFLHGSLWDHAFRPWRASLLPGTWVVMFHYAGLVGGVVSMSTIGAQLVSMPPYLWAANAGLINIGALVGVIAGYIYTTLLADAKLKAKVKRRSENLVAVAEPEDRLPTLFFPLAVASAGFLVFGFCGQYPGPNRWVGLCAGFAMLSFGLMQVPSVGFNYLIDSYHRLAADCFTIVTIMRAIIAFVWTCFIARWAQRSGVAEAFGILGMLMGLFSLLSVPLWLYGKRMRIATAHQVEPYF